MLMKESIFWVGSTNYSTDSRYYGATMVTCDCHGDSGKAQGFKKKGKVTIDMLMGLL